MSQSGATPQARARLVVPTLSSRGDVWKAPLTVVEDNMGVTVNAGEVYCEQRRPNGPSRYTSSKYSPLYPAQLGYYVLKAKWDDICDTYGPFEYVGYPTCPFQAQASKLGAEALEVVLRKLCNSTTPRPPFLFSKHRRTETQATFWVMRFTGCLQDQHVGIIHNDAAKKLTKEGNFYAIEDCEKIVPTPAGSRSPSVARSSRSTSPAVNPNARTSSVEAHGRSSIYASSSGSRSQSESRAKAGIPAFIYDCDHMSVDQKGQLTHNKIKGFAVQYGKGACTSNDWVNFAKEIHTALCTRNAAASKPTPPPVPTEGLADCIAWLAARSKEEQTLQWKPFRLRKTLTIGLASAIYILEKMPLEGFKASSTEQVPVARPSNSGVQSSGVEAGRREVLGKHSRASPSSSSSSPRTGSPSKHSPIT